MFAIYNRKAFFAGLPTFTYAKNTAPKETPADSTNAGTNIDISIRITFLSLML